MIAWAFLVGRLIGAWFTYNGFRPAYAPPWRAGISFFAGWLAAMTTGIPGWPPPWMFLRNTLLSGGLFTGLFAAAMKLTASSESELDKEPVKASEGEGEEVPEPGKADA